MHIPTTKKRTNKKVRNATPKEYDGYTFRSKLEAYCYTKLKEANLKFEYESVKFTLLEPFEYDAKSYEMIRKKGAKVYDLAGNNIRGITYTPDFTNLNEGWIIECKGNPNESFPLRWKLFKKHIKDYDLKYDLYLPRNKKQIDKTIELIKSNRKNESI